MATKKKTVKKVAKKVTKTTAKVGVLEVLAFSKANAKLFADNIYSDHQGRVTFLKLCSGDLSNGKDGGRTLHCALGEAYFTFVNPLVAKFVSSVTKEFGENISDREDNDDEKGYTPKYTGTGAGTDHAPTRAVVDALVDVAQLRNQKLETKQALAQALLDTMEVNDDTCSVDVSDSLQRSKEVAEVWREQVLPLLK